MADWHRDDDGLALRLPLDGKPHLLRAEFLRGPMGYRLRKGGGRGEAVARAAGIRGSATPSILDATAGLGRDAFLFAWLGCRVEAVERHPQVHALLCDAWERARREPEVASRIGDRLQIVHADAAAVLRERAAAPPGQRPEVVYLDPMHPERRSAGQVRKEMRLFRELVGEDPDAAELLELARAVARRRVVVKRPRRGAPLGSPPDQELTGKSTRFDIYLAASRGKARDPRSPVD